MGVFLVALGAVLVVLAFLLAFTLYGEVGAGLGALCVVIGALMVASRRPEGPRA